MQCNYVAPEPKRHSKICSVTQFFQTKNSLGKVARPFNKNRVYLQGTYASCLYEELDSEVQVRGEKDERKGLDAYL